MGLTDKRRAFITEYLRDFNATQAALRAGYSPKTAGSIGHDLLKIPEISQAIQTDINDRTMTAGEVLTRLTDIARGDIADLMALSTAGFTFELATNDDNGNLIPNPKTKLIKKIKQKVTTIIGKNTSDEDREIIETELELYDAKSALDTLAKVHKLFTDGSDTPSEIVVRITHDNKDG